MTGKYHAPAPVLVTEKDLPKVLLVITVGCFMASLLILQLDAYFAAKEQDPSFQYPKVGYFLSAYMVILLGSRYKQHGAYILYEALWGCNISILLVILGCFLCKPFLVGVAMVIVSGDQLCWFIDVFSYLLTGKFTTGVIKYLTYPENRTFSKRVFALHHIWFLPLCIWVTKGHGGMHESSFIAACIITSFLATYCRFFTPFQAKVPGEEHIIYLNINGAYEFWKDVNIPLLHFLDHHHPLLYLPYLSITGNLVANGVPHIIVHGIALGVIYHFEY